jgi:hypothetical protein
MNTLTAIGNTPAIQNQRSEFLIQSDDNKLGFSEYQEVDPLVLQFFSGPTVDF